MTNFESITDLKFLTDISYVELYKCHVALIEVGILVVLAEIEVSTMVGFMCEHYIIITYSYVCSITK